MSEMIRVNTRISKSLNDWLDEQSELTGMSKSTLIYLALENYRNETYVVDQHQLQVNQLTAEVESIKKMLSQANIKPNK